MTNKIRFSQNCIEVLCERGDTETANKLVDFYPLHKNRLLTDFKLSPHKAPEVLKALRGLTIDNLDTAPPSIQEIYMAEISKRENLVDLLKNGPRQSCVVSPLLTLDPHQQLARELAEYYNRFAFFYDTRTGKTPLALTIINDDIQKHPEHKWLVVCPLILIYNAWLDDIGRFYPDMKVSNCHASTPAKRQAAIQVSANLYLTNTESFVNYRRYFEDKGFTGVFVDESSDLKSTTSKVSKEMVEFAQTVKRFYLLSGTPAPNGEHEYYMQMRCVDYYGWHQSYAQFKEYYFVNLSYNVRYEDLVLRPDRKEEFYNKIKELAIYVDKEDVLDTPGRTFHDYMIEMPADLAKHYKKLKNDMYVQLQDEVRITVPSAAAKLNKLNQVTSGFIMDTQARKDNEVYGTDNAEWYLLNNYRFDALKQLLDKEGVRGEQVLIWANYRREFELIKNMLGEDCTLVYGGLSIEDKNNAIRDFKEGRVRYLVANPASADKGLTLTNAHIAIYFSLTWSYELFKQSYDRIYASKRIQPKHCDYYIMMAKGTIDEVLYREVLSGKQSNSLAILNHLKAEALL